MAMVNSYNSKPRKSLPKQILLKDYLLDDLSSCSSNGFRSFPRRQCCSSTVRFLVTDSAQNKQKAQKNKKAQKKPKKSLFKRASAALISAAARLLSSSAAVRPPEGSLAPVTCLPRGLKRWKYINYFAVSNAVSIAVSNAVSESEKSNCDGNCSGELDGTCGELDGTCVKNGDVYVAAASTSSTQSSSSQNKWQNEEDKEQFSPVSVMDFPSTDEEEVSSPDEVSSPFQSRLACVEGRKKKLMQNLRRFEGLAKLEPIDLSKKFTLSQQTNESIDSSSPQSSLRENITNMEEKMKEGEEKEKNEAAHKALDMLDQMKTTSENLKFDFENILFDFFIKGVRETKGNKNENELIFEAKDWMNGNPQEMYLGWEEEKNRLPYMKDMEKSGDWNIRNIKSLDEHKKEVAFELEVEVLALIVDELVLDLVDV